MDSYQLAGMRYVGGEMKKSSPRDLRSFIYHI